MRNAILGFLLVIATVAAIILNFNSMLKGSPASLVNIITTIFYLGIWGSIFIYALRHKIRNLIIFSVIFWCTTLLTYLAAIYVIITDGTSGIIILFVMFFLTPLYGIMVCNINNIIGFIIIAFISSFFIYFGIMDFVKKSFLSPASQK